MTKPGRLLWPSPVVYYDQFYFRKYVPHALKGQKLIAQGSALGNQGRKPVAL